MRSCSLSCEAASFAPGTKQQERGKSPKSETSDTRRISKIFVCLLWFRSSGHLRLKQAISFFCFQLFPSWFCWHSQPPRGVWRASCGNSAIGSPSEPGTLLLGTFCYMSTWYTYWSQFTIHRYSTLHCITLHFSTVQYSTYIHTLSYSVYRLQVSVCIWSKSI